MIDVYCVNVSTKYSTEYVHKLKTAVEKHLSLPHKFWCITDKPELYPFSIQADDLPGWWNKISVFKYTGSCLYFDLDVIIHNSIDELVSDTFKTIPKLWKDPHEAVIVLDRPDLGTSPTNSSVMAWSNEQQIYEKFMEDPEYYILKYYGDDRFLAHETKYDTFDSGLVYSYRAGAHWKNDNASFKYRPDYSVALFHQKPEIHECLDHEITKEHWI